MSGDSEFYYGGAKLVGECIPHYDTNEADVEIWCECDNRFHIYLTESMVQCNNCRKIYKIVTKVEIYEEIKS